MLSIHVFFNEDINCYGVSFWISHKESNQSKLSFTAWLSSAELERLKYEIARSEEQYAAYEEKSLTVSNEVSSVTEESMQIYLNARLARPE